MRASRYFCFLLARQLGIWNVDEMMRQMPSHLLSEWIAFFKIESEDQTQRQLAREAKRGVEERVQQRKSKRR